MPDMANEEEDRAYTPTCCNSDGVEYRLFDIVMVYDGGFKVPHVGKILRMWEERSSGTRKALICWFLWHKEVKPQDADNPRELFLACGKDTGVTNELNVDSIISKCKVVCTSNDPRNKEPSVHDIENADFVFSHAYDVDHKNTIPVEVVADKLGPNVIFNTEEWLIAITKVEEGPDEVQTFPSVGSSLSESKKRSRDAEVVSNLQKKKVDKQEDVRKGHPSSEEFSKKKKIKVADGAAPVSKEKARESSTLEKEEMVKSKRQSPKIETGSRLSKAHITEVKQPVAVEGSELDKASTPTKPSVDKMDILEQIESIKEGILGQGDDEALLHEKVEDEETQKLDNVIDNASKMEKAQAEEREEADHEPAILDREFFFSKKPIVELDIALKADSTKESMPKIAKKTKSILSVEAEKRPISAAETDKPWERRSIFKKLPWEENLQQGIPLGKVLHLRNVDPLITSTDMREMLKSTFHGLSDARVLPKETMCPSGQAIAIFDTKTLADCALEAIETDCLVMADKKWPVIASKVKESVNQIRFPGHLALEKLKLGRNLVTEDYRKAVSTSHCSQPNTIEFEMAMEWRQLQEVTQSCRIELFKKQRRELNDLTNRGSGKAQRSKQDGV